MQHPKMFTSHAAPGTASVERSVNTGNAYYCNRHGVVLEHPTWILVGDINANDYEAACPVCFNAECPRVGEVGLVAACHSAGNCPSPSTVTCSRCHLGFCQWHVGKTSKKLYLCKKCADAVPPSGDYRCVTCQTVTGMKCEACGQYTCHKHFSKADSRFCMYCGKLSN